MCHEHLWEDSKWFKFKSGSWPIHRSHFFYFHDTGSFPTYILLCLSRSFVLDNQSNVGSQGEAWRYNSTFDRAQQRAIAAWLLWLYKSSPKSHKKPRWHTLTQHARQYLGGTIFFCRCFSIVWCAVLEKCQDARTWVLNWIFDDFCILKVFAEVKVAIRHCRHHFYHPHNQSSWIRKNRMFQPGSIEDGVRAFRRSQHFARQRCHRHHRFCTMVANAFASRPGKKAFTLGRCFQSHSVT